jgi:hypothetical protein
MNSNYLIRYDKCVVYNGSLLEGETLETFVYNLEVLEK